MSFTEQLASSLKARLEELHSEIASLTQAHAELVRDGASPAWRGSTRAGRRPARRPRGQPPPSSIEVAPAAKLHLLLSESDGLSTAALSERTNADPAQVLPLLREMEAAGKVRRTGQRRATRWHAVANQEEWVALRAAELAARSRGG